MCFACWQEVGSPRIWNDSVKTAVDLIDEADASGGEFVSIVIDDWNIDDRSVSSFCGVAMTNVERRLWEAMEIMNEQERASAIAKADRLW